MKNLQSKKYDTRLLVAIVIYLFFFPHTRPLEIFLNKRPLFHKLLLLKRLEILIVWECGVCACDHRNVYCLNRVRFVLVGIVKGYQRERIGHERIGHI